MGRHNITLADIAEKLKLSKSTVSLVLNDSNVVSDKTRVRVLEAAQAMGYIKNELFSAMMSNMKRRSVSSFSGTVALVNGNADKYALVNHPTFPKYCIGIREEAERLNYKVGEFWLGDPSLTAESFAKKLRVRGIRGGIIIGHSFSNVFPDSFKPVWDEFHFISAGIKTANPSLEMVAADHYEITYQAVLKAKEMGFKRVGLVIEKHIDEIVGGRFIGGFLRAQFDFSDDCKLPPFVDSDTDRGFVGRLYKWMNENRPDAVLYLLDSTRELIHKSPNPAHGEIALIQLERRGYAPDWMGMEQNNDIVGAVAMRRLADILNRFSLPNSGAENIVTFIPPTWENSSELKESKF